MYRLCVWVTECECILKHLFRDDRLQLNECVSSIAANTTTAAAAADDDNRKTRNVRAAAHETFELIREY